MSRFLPLIALAAAIAGIWATSFADTTAAPAKDKPANLNYTLNDIDGKPVDLASYSGKVILVVNVASHCGFTKQYTALEKLYKDYKDKGFVILAFPANNFGAQEPGTNTEIKEFCTGKDSKYHVSFPIFSKISVKGDDISPFYKHLITQDVKPKGKGDVKWNFEKFLIAKDGTLIGRYESKVTPDDKELVAAIDAELAK